MSLRVEAVGETTSLAWRKQRAGQRLIVGFPTTSLTEDLRNFCREVRPAGFILFAHNVEEPAQVRELNRELVSLLPGHLPPLLSVDQEGGRVQRVRATAWPRARWVGNAGDPKLSFEFGSRLGEELHALGFNLDFAPVCDVDSNPKNPVIGDRAFASDARAVARHAVAVMHGLHSQGLIACAKHFPGHGDTSQDSHLELPRVEKEPPELREVELLPFRAAIAAGVGMIMTAHVVFPGLDDDLPATLSRRILHDLLREEMGYQGVLISDDLEMKAVRGRYALEQQMDLGCRAGIDLFCVSHELPLAMEAFENLVRLQENDPAHDTLAEDSERRLRVLRERFLLDRTPQPDLAVVGSPAHQQLAQRLRALGES